MNMKISSLEKAEQIVSKNKNMHWDGWDIVHLIEDPNGYIDSTGIFKNDKWHTSNIFKLEDNGWNIPERFMAK